jgi:uncharacterized protein
MSDLVTHIASLHVYPVKSCAGIALDQSQVLPTGLAHDRTWMVVDADGEMVSQRDFARMCLIAPTWRGKDVVLQAPGMPDLLLGLDQSGRALRVRVWGDVLKAQDMGEAAADWITDYLYAGDANARGQFSIVRFDPDQQRLADTKWTGGERAMSQFSDGFPILVASVGSLHELNRRLAAQGHSAVDMARFRPNIVLAGLDAHDEDHISELNIDTPQGTVRLHLCKPCPRCPMPNIDPATGKSSPEVGDTLQTYRSDARVNGAVTFGMNAYVVDETGMGFSHRFQVGQQVQAMFDF